MNQGSLEKRLARDAATATAGAPAGVVEVIGEGTVAAEIRRLVGIQPLDSAEAPAAIVDTTGDPTVIRAATERLADSGVLVLAGDPRDRQLSLNLYPDVHGRGLRIVGVGP